nr:putative ribonuclease H-like domain-containing protein [Tanacetum cinerariifolium]
MPALEDITYSNDEEDVGAEADFSNLETIITVSPIPTTRVHKDHLVTQIIGDLSLATQTRSMNRIVKYQGGLTQINNKDFRTCMFACFLSQEEPKRVHQALKDPSWIEAMHEELLQFKMQKEQKDERLIVVRNKARLVAQGHTQKEGIDYEEVLSPVARIEAIRLFLAYASFMRFMVYQMDVKSAFMYGTIEEEVYVCQPLGFEDPDYPDKVYKVVKVLYGLHQAPKAWYETLASYLLENGFQRGKIDQTLFIKKQKANILLVQVNDVVHLQALIDRKKVIITKATIREALRLNDAKSIDCLPNEEIFTELSRMGYDGARQADDVADEVVAGVDVDVVPAVDVEPTLPSPTPTTQPPPPPQELPSTSHVAPTPPPSPIAQPSSPPQQQQPSQPTTFSMDLFNNLRMHLNRGIIELIDADKDFTLEEVEIEKNVEVEKDVDVQGRPEESEAQIYKIDLEHADKVLSMQDYEPEPAVELQEVIEVVTTVKLMTEVVTAATTTITVFVPITAATITATPSAARRRKRSKQVQRKEKEDNVVLRYQALKRKPQIEGQARKNMMIYLRNMAGFKMDTFKGMSYDDIRPTFEKYFNSNVAFLKKTKEQLQEEESRALKRQSKSLEEKAVKKQKLDEEVEELKKHLQIVPNDDNDVYTEATSLALKVTVVDYEIYTENNKPYYKIINDLAGRKKISIDKVYFRLNAQQFGLIVPAFLNELIYKVHGLLVLLLELNRFGILLGELGVGQVVSSVIGGILSIEARDMDTKLLSAPESNNTLARWTVSSIPNVFSWGGSIGPEGFWPFILWLTVIIVTVAIVVTVVLVVVAAIIRIVVVVVGVPSIIKLSFLITGGLIGLFYSSRLGVCISPGQGVIGQGFEDPEFHDIVYKVEKALYGLHQAPRAWSRLISWQCKNQTVVANSTTEADGLYTNDYWNKVKQLLRMDLRLTLVTAKAKNINEEAHIHAKVDGKKVIISKATIKRDLKFEDEGGVDCLSNEVIFEQPSLMSESIPEADIPLRKRARFTTHTSRYEIGESYVAAATARQIRPTLTIAESLSRGPYQNIGNSDGGLTEGC